MPNPSFLTSDITPYFATNVTVNLDNAGIFTCEIGEMTFGMKANSDFFGHPVWGPEYFESSHRCDIFKSRWQAATGSWDDKVVVDIGCGPGNIYATVGGHPKILIGVDISYDALKMAKQVGYTPLWADAQHLPLIDGFADLVVANATLHHCDDMARVLSEASRLVRPGGLLVTDLDPQVTAMNLKGLGAFLRKHRFIVYRLINSRYYLPEEGRNARLATEIHNREPGDGITPDLYYRVLESLGFEINLYPHNHDIGAEVFGGNPGKGSPRLRLAQRLSGINPDTPEAAQSIMCIARRTFAEKSSP